MCTCSAVSHFFKLLPNVTGSAASCCCAVHLFGLLASAADICRMPFDSLPYTRLFTGCRASDVIMHASIAISRSPFYNLYSRTCLLCVMSSSPSLFSFLRTHAHITPTHLSLPRMPHSPFTCSDYVLSCRVHCCEACIVLHMAPTR